MKRLLIYLSGYKRQTILAPLFKLSEASLELIVPLIIAKIIDNGILKGDYAYVGKMCALLVLLGAVGLAFSCTAQYFAAAASVGFVAKVRDALFGKVQTLSYSDLDKIGVSTLITRMTSDTSKVQNGLNLALRLLLRSPFVVFGAMIMAFIVNPRPSVSFAVAIPILLVVVFGIMLITMPMYKRVQARTDDLMLSTRENLSGVRVVRAFCKEKDEIAKFSAKNTILTTVHKRVGMISSLMNPLTYVIINLAILWLVYLGAVEVDVTAGEFTQGEVIALYNYMSQILIELIKLANLIISITKALASADRIADVLDFKPTENMGKLAEWRDNDCTVEFRDASLTYSGAGESSLVGISFKAMRGETVGIIGCTGSGKTSLVNMIPGFYKPTDGEVLINGVPVSEYSPAFLREKIGIVPQRAVLLGGTVRENMQLGAKEASDEEIYTALDIACAREVVDSKGGLDARVEESGRNFSGGQRQRLTIARALVSKPEILILDDSTSALDYKTDLDVRTALKTVQGKSTVFIVSQRTSSIMHADRIIVLDDGQVVGIGTHGELLDSCEIYREIYSSQYREEGKNNG